MITFMIIPMQISSGQPLEEIFTRLTRDGNTFAVNLSQHKRRNLLYPITTQSQIEHVAVLDNISDFKDVIYNPSSDIDKILLRLWVIGLLVGMVH